MTDDIKFTGITFVENNKYKDTGKGDPEWISLHSERVQNGRFSKAPWTFGSFTGKKLLEVFPSVLMAYADWTQIPVEKQKVFIYPYTIDGPFPSKQDWTELRVKLFQNYLEDIKEYVDKYAKTINGPRRLIDAPEVIMISDLSVSYDLLVPCYPKRDMDTGDGVSGAWDINTWTAKMLFDPTHQIFSKCKEAVDKGSTDPIVINYLTRSGDKKEFTLDEFQIRAFVSYKPEITDYKATYVV